ncbi:MAG: class I SAM-dependent methyltransferase [Deltaproteobacteria bacterium]|nr:class I SAM-dependent methyltransferase [Deltaproteobacteria bacterium]MBW1922254.1 class I SAM-dependent methyltransferase [Deltaproteobacteria bacterium]MBW1949529.1 class I SAM-dependent methyltransferase [Deltaproteobacteria bacterium]MBW2008420.1 class I SAM-dependent methyltransferase [Deltaproteobacteria bacterium]MBW2102182.1 class I SAM-dependent methyltransferase [Deltaproteobacteria bacterium]
MRWEAFLSDRAHFNLYISALVYMPTIKIIRRLARPGEMILEAGCGSGRTAMLLSDMGYRVAALDLSRSLLRRIMPATAFFTGLSLLNGDITALPFSDKSFAICYSCGVLEHFTPEEIIFLLAEQRRVAHRVLVDVPNHRCRKRSYGDEHFYTDEQWRSMLTRAGLAVEQVIHRGLDRGRYVGNCSVFLASDPAYPHPVHEETDVYDHY